MQNGRITWIDSLKGFAILLVIIGHVNFDSFISVNFDPQAKENYIYSFHMPLFFFISGFLFNSEKWIFQTKEFFINRFTNIILPYFSFTIISIGFWFAVSMLFDVNHEVLNLSSANLIYNIIYAHFSKIGFNGPLWFLPALFITEVLYFCTEKTLKNKYLIVIAVFILTLIGVKYSILKLPWHINSALVGFAFYVSGKYFKSNMDLFLNNWTFTVLAFLLNISLGFKIRYDMQSCAFNDIHVFYITAMSGILLYIQIFYQLDKIGFQSKILDFFGKNSLIILCTHTLLIALIQFIFGFYNSDISILMVILFEIPTIFIINKYAVWIIGKPFTIPTFNKQRNFD